MTPTGHPSNDTGSGNDVERGPCHLVSDLDHARGGMLGGFRLFHRNHGLNNALTLGGRSDEASRGRTGLCLGGQQAGDGGIEGNIHAVRLAAGLGYGDLKRVTGLSPD